MLTLAAALAAAEETVHHGPSAVDSAGFFLDFAWLVPLLPALSFVGILLFGKRLPRKGSELGLARGRRVVRSVSRRGDHLDRPTATPPTRGSQPCTAPWAGCSPGGVQYDAGILVDGLSVMMLFVVTTVSLLVHVYSTDYVAGDARYTHFFAFLRPVHRGHAVLRPSATTSCR